MTRPTLILLVFLSPSFMAAAQDQGQKPAQPQPSSSPETPSLGDSTQLDVVKSPRAVYPKEAKDEGLQGQVLISLLISETGDVESTEIISGNSILAKAAEEAMRQWKFKPYIRNGKPVKVKTKMPYDFEFGGNKIVVRMPGEVPGPAPSSSPTELAPFLESSSGPNQNGMSKVVKVPQGVIEGLIVHRVDPVYPLEAKRNHIVGVVILQATIGKDGRIYDLRVISGHAVLAEAAIGAVQQWRYQPCTLNGEPVDVQTTVKVGFYM